MSFVKRLSKVRQLVTRTNRAGSSMASQLFSDDLRGALALMSALISSLMTHEPRIRDASSEEILRYLHQIRFRSIVDQSHLAPKGLAAILLERDGGLHHHLASTRHLGVLSDLSQVVASRLDYVLLQCKMILDLKQTHPGMGLSSRTDIEFRGKHLTGLEIAQSLAILLSNGHLFGTFATERAVMYALFAKSEDGSVDDLIAQIDSNLRDWAEAIVRSRSLYRFHYVLAALEVSFWENAEIRECAIAILQRLSMHQADFDNIMWAFRASRQLAYNQMHELMDLGVVIQAKDWSELVRSVRLAPEIGFGGKDEDDALGRRMLYSFDAFHAEVFFNTDEAAAVVLRHLHEFASWWRAGESRSVTERIAHLRTCPADWPRPQATYTRPTWTRIRIPPGNWIDTVTTFRSDDPYLIWRDADFIVTPLPLSTAEYQLLDIYSQHVGADCLHHLASTLHKQLNSPAASFGRHAGPSVARFGIAALDQLFKTRYRSYLRPTATSAGEIAYSILEFGEPCEKAVRKQAALVSDATRRGELETIAEYLHRGNCIVSGHPWLLFLGNIFVVDTEAEGHQEVAEIDGALAVFYSNHTEWHLLEIKHGNAQGTGAKQLKRLRRYLDRDRQAEPSQVERQELDSCRRCSRLVVRTCARGQRDILPLGTPSPADQRG